VWEGLEVRFRQPIGALFIDHTQLRINLAVYRELFYRCAVAAGEEASYEQVTEAVLGIGLARAHELATQLFEDLFKTSSKSESGEGDGPPLASGA
jgi:hypothetical protein